MAYQYYVSHNGQELGPFSMPEIEMKLGAGELLPGDYLFDPKLDDWVLLAERVSVKSEKPSAPPPSAIAPGEEPPPVTQVSRIDHIVASTTAQAPLPTAPMAPVGPPKPAPQAPVPMTQPYPTASAPTPKPAPIRINMAPQAAQPAPAMDMPQPPAPTGGSLEIKNGVGQMDLSILRAGLVQIKIEDRPAGIKSPESMDLHVQAASATRVLWSMADQGAAGQEMRMSFKAIDAFGNIDTHFAQLATLSIVGPQTRDLPLQFRSGECEAPWRETKAGSYTLELKWKGPVNLQAPRKNCEVHAGPAVELVFDNPKSLKAGEKAQVVVKAVDAFGNLATDFSTTLKLKAS